MELTAAVRQISPFALALLDQGGVPVLDVLDGMPPPSGWPDRPGIPAYRYIPYSDADDGDGDGPRPPGIDVLFPDGANLHVHVIDHSVEAAGRLGDFWFVSLFGRLWVELPRDWRPLRRKDVRGCRVEDVLPLPECLQRDWLVDGLSATDGRSGQTLIVRTGVERLKMREPVEF